MTTKLTENERNILEAIAAHGTIDHDELAEATERTARSVMATIRSLTTKGLVDGTGLTEEGAFTIEELETPFLEEPEEGDSLTNQEPHRDEERPEESPSEVSEGVTAEKQEEPSQALPASPEKPKRGRPRKEAAPKPEPVMYGEYELKADVSEDDIARIKELTEEASKASSSLARKEEEALDTYLAFGKFQSQVAPLFKSTKVYGQFLAKELPATQTLDPALRSNCKWLYEALHDPKHEAHDILPTLAKAEGLEVVPNDLSGFRSKNPTVIRRRYKEAKTLQAKEEKAREEGIASIDELEAKEKAEKKARKEAADTSLREAVEAFGAWLRTSKRIEHCANGATSTLATLLNIAELNTEVKEEVARYLLETSRVATPAE